MANETRELRAGSRLTVTLTDDETGQVVMQEEHEVVEAPSKPGTTRGAAATPMTTRVVSQRWLDPALEALNAETAEPARTTRGGGAAGAAEAAKLGLEVAKFAWQVIKDNAAVASGKATTTSALHTGSRGEQYEGARVAKAPKYTLSVHDSLIKSWELVHAEIACEGSYGARPTGGDIPPGSYLPAINVYSPKVSADWPCQVEVAAEVSAVTNLGRGSIDPMLTILCSLKYGWIAQRRQLTIKFVAQGSRGFRRG